jgi:hypothetical protein
MHTSARSRELPKEHRNTINNLAECPKGAHTCTRFYTSAAASPPGLGSSPPTSCGSQPPHCCSGSGRGPSYSSPALRLPLFIPLFGLLAGLRPCGGARGEQRWGTRRRRAAAVFVCHFSERKLCVCVQRGGRQSGSLCAQRGGAYTSAHTNRRTHMPAAQAGRLGPDGRTDTRSRTRCRRHTGSWIVLLQWLRFCRFPSGRNSASSPVAAAAAAMQLQQCSEPSAQVRLCATSEPRRRRTNCVRKGESQSELT